MKFTDFPPCKHRFGCVECRNNPKFVEHMENRFGKWECPEGIALNTPLEQMPPHIKEKIESYKNKMQRGDSKEVTAPPQGNPVYQNRGDVNGFTSTPQCQRRMMCYQCRNDERFRGMMEGRYGPWECPLKIPIGTPLEGLPPEAQEMHRKQEEQRKLHQERLDGARESLDALEQVIPPSSLHMLDRLRFFIFPNEKVPTVCIHAGEAVKVEETCCGGTVKTVDGVKCKKHNKDAGPKMCARCGDYEREHTTPGAIIT